MSIHAKGSFEVSLKPLETYNQTADARLAHFSLDKQFQGDLAATSQGEMLSAGTAIENSAGYVAIELVSGTLHGRTGTFVLQHSSTISRGVPQQSINVVPDSGTAELIGLVGQMVIIIAEGKHSYDFEYTLP